MKVKALVLRLDSRLVQHEHEAGLEEYDGDERAYDALCKRKPQVGAYLELHAHEREEAHHRGQRAGRHRFCGFGYGGGEGLLWVASGAQFVAVLMQQEDGVVHAQPELQYSRHREGDHGRGREYGVGAQVDDDGDRERQHEDERLHQRVGGEREDEQDYDARGDEIDPQLVKHRLIEGVCLFRHAAHGVAAFPRDVFEDGLDLAEYLYGFLRGGGIFHGDEQRPVALRALFIFKHAVLGDRGGALCDRVREDVVHLRELFVVGRVDAEIEQHLHILRPHRVGDAFELEDLIRRPLDLFMRRRHAYLHIAVDVEGLGEECVALARLVVVGKVGSEVVIDLVDHRRQKRRRDRDECNEHRKNDVTVFDYTFSHDRLPT